MDWSEFHAEVIGKRFIRRKDGRQETRLVIDTMLGCGVIYRHGPRLAYQTHATYEDWQVWVKDAKRG